MLRIFAVVAVSLIAFAAMAQAVPDTGDSVQFVIANWQTFGWLGGLAALLNVAVILFRKIPQGAALWDRLPKLGQLAIVFVLAAIAATLFGFLGGIGWQAAIGIGVMAGFTAIGSNQVGKALKPESKDVSVPNPTTGLGSP